MSLLKIALYPAPILHQVAVPVASVDEAIRKLLDDMAETMYRAPGIGLAAPQVNVSKRVVVIDVGHAAPDGEARTHVGLQQMVNPEILSREGEIEWEEACLSVPGFHHVMTRSKKITCRFLDRDGKEQTITALNLLAVAIQHEIDHLDGKLIIDSVSRLQRDLYLEKLKKGKVGRDQLIL